MKSNDEVVNSPSVVVERQDYQNISISEEACSRMDNAKDAHFQHLGNKNIDNTSLSNPRAYSDNNETISKSDRSDDESDNNFHDSDKNIPRQDSKEKFYNLLKAISLEYGVNSTKAISPTTASTHPKTIEEETVDDDLPVNATAGSAKISQLYDCVTNNAKSANTTDQQVGKTMLTNYVTATSINSPITAQEVTATGTESKLDVIQLEKSPNDSKESSTQVNSPDMMLTSLCNTQGKVTDEDKKYRAMHKRAHQSYRTSTFINPPSLSDSGSTNADSPSTKILDSDIVVSPIVESAATHSAEGNRCDTGTPLLKSKVTDIGIQPKSIKLPVLQAPTANSEESHIIHEESRYIDDMSNISAGISLLKSSKRYRRLFGGKKKNKFGDSTMSIIHSDISMTSNTSTLSKRFKKKKKTLAAQQSTKLLMSLNGNDLHDNNTVQSMTLLAIHDDVAQQKLALAKKYRKVEAEVFQSERTYQRHLKVIIKVCLVMKLSNRLYLTK